MGRWGVTASRWSCMSAVCLILATSSYSQRATAMQLFDTNRMPKEAELVPIDITALTFASPRSRGLNGESRADESDDHMPSSLEVDFICRGKRQHFRLEQHSGPSSPLTPKSDPGEIPLLTRTSSTGPVHVDHIPRIFSRHCRTYQDKDSQAVFLVIRDFEFSSFKLFGSFLMSDGQFFIEPFNSSNSKDSKRLHLATSTPNLDFSSDSGSVLLRTEGQHLKKLKKRQTFAPRRDSRRQEQQTGSGNGNRNGSRQRGFVRAQREAMFNYEVEVIIACDFLCYQRFQTLYDITDSLKTKNVIALYFSFVREVLKISYASVHKLYPEMNMDIDVSVPALFIADSPDIK
ncbi:uncharacterized protein LOC106013709, partial [Aplysia californica]|uniref:Uncharacterized protein LOC106013709 n=1 Tax=Aplysia californica TaxID=6500 RepID=A0ABM1ADH4_APLCA